MKTYLKYLPLASLLLIACGGNSAPNIDRSLPITSMTDQQRQDFCSWQAAALGGEGKQYTCNGQPLHVKAVSDCVTALRSAPASCNFITYGEIKDCADAEAQDLCTGVGSTACIKFASDAAACSPMPMPGNSNGG